MSMRIFIQTNLFPLKALAQDQFKGFNALAESLPEDIRPRAAIYDGDTTPWFRKKIRENPPNVLMTNPEMLHLSLLRHHDKWAAFLAALELVVVDEVHTCRGVMGSHMAQVFRRLLRVCAYFGTSPAFAFLSATVGNPEELAHDLTGLSAQAVTASGAPQGGRHFVFVNPAESTAESASRVAIQLLKAALARGLRTIVYTQSRKMTELIALWAAQRAGKYSSRISAYRAGFLPEERREIEAGMVSGELLAVVSTSALELGIDIGSLDLCLLVGYPGTIISTLQRGGRVGRSMRESAVGLIACEDALDQYFMRNPRDFFARAPERAVLNPVNPVILEKHLECAAAELPISLDEPWFLKEEVRRAAGRLEAEGALLRSDRGGKLYARRREPHRKVSLRGAGRGFHILAKDPSKARNQENAGAADISVGRIDEYRAYHETHPGAVYLHRGQTYVVKELDLEVRVVRVAQAKVDYYTRVRSRKETEILEVTGSCPAWGTRAFKGRLKVTETVIGYEKRKVRGGTLMTIVPLDLPPLVFETEGLWLEIPRRVQDLAEDERLHFMGGIHALEHAAIGILPLLVMTDRNDLGGISTPFHPQVGSAAVFIYDGVPGGVGLSSSAFDQAGELLERTLGVIESCSCEFGCPSCIQSPKCGSGNRPLDKTCALFLLEALRSGPRQENISIQSTESFTKKPTKEVTEMFERSGMTLPKPRNSLHYGVFDLETRRSAREVGGWNKADRMGVSCAVLYDSKSKGYETYFEEDISRLIQDLEQLDLVVGFNLKRFDYFVLSGCNDYNFQGLPTLDMLEEVHKRLGYRLSLGHLASATLRAAKTADGLQALAWWKQGRMDEIVKYCKQDVAITRDLFLFGRENGYLLFTNKAQKTVRLPVDW
ncbi:MAG: Zn-binding domain-containing protein [Thermodesulfobacteriota bacterium]|nr:Zn-binding domain-containing protein [Thermodesulfobacteriota bacterium]